MVKDQYLSTLTMAPFTIAGQLIGVQNLMTALYDEDVDLQPLFNVAERLCTEVNNLLLIAGADMVALADPVASGALISQEMFEQYALPRLRSVLPQLARPEQVLLHICGNTTARLDSLSHLGINAFSLDDVNLNTALAAAQGHFAVMGNLSPFAVMASKPAAEVKLLAARCCAAAGKNGGFILAPGCDLPSATPLENIQALTAGALGAGQLLNSY